MARSAKGGLARAVKSEALVVAAFALSACEVFLIYRNFRMPLFESEELGLSLLGGLASVCVTLVACLAMLAAYLISGKRIGEDRHLTAALCCSAGGPVLNLVGGHWLELTFLNLVGAALTSVGCAIFLLAIVRYIVGFGVRCSAHCSVACCLCLLVAAPVSILISIEGFTCLIVALSCAVFACLRGLSTARKEIPEPANERQKLPRVLVLTVVLVGLVEGVVAAIDEPNLVPQDKFVMFSLALVTAAVVAAVVLLRMKGSFNTVLYRLCIPLIASGIAIFAIGGREALIVGSFAVLVGRQVFAAAILALVVYLVRYRDSDYYLLVLGVLIGAMVGNLIGLGVCQLIDPGSFPTIMSAPFGAFLLFFMLVTSIWLMDASNTQTRWGMVSIDDAQETVGLTLEQSCEELASQRGLTKRETEIVVQLARGRDRQTIAERLFISEGTVKVHMRNIYQKLDIHSKQELLSLVEKIEDSFKE